MLESESVNRNLALLKDDPSKVLGVKVAQHTITPGTHVPKADAKSPPELSFDGSSPSKTYLVVCLDLDAPFPALSLLGPILHWIQPGLKSADGSSALTSSEPFIADYAPPGPPPGSGPHRYVFFLYEQPDGFVAAKYAPPNGQSTPVMKRMRYRLDEFEKEAQLSPAIAINYFTSN